MCDVYKIIFFIFFCANYVFGQQSNINVQWSQKISSISRDLPREYRKPTRVFLRNINSDKIKVEHKNQIYAVLNNFETRKLNFTNYYVPFFKLVNQFQNQELPVMLFEDILHFLSFSNDVYSSRQLKIFLNNIHNFLLNNILYSVSEHVWFYEGEYDFFINDNRQPVFHFLDADLFLHNKSDTVEINNIRGYYNLLNNSFQVDNAVCHHDSDGFVFDVELKDFSLNLSKKFFSVENAYLTMQGPFYGSAIGIYKNKLTSSTSFPSFSSQSKQSEFEIFEGIKIFGAVDLKGNLAYFTSSLNPVVCSFHNNDVEYFFNSNRFQLDTNSIRSSNVQFLVQNGDGSIYHPSANFVYDNNDKSIVVSRCDDKRGLNPIRNTWHGLNMFVDKLKFNLLDNNVLLFNTSFGRDISVLFESDTYFDIGRYRDLLRFDINPAALLIEFISNKDFNNYFTVPEFAEFAKISNNDAVDIILDLEIFGIIEYNQFNQICKLNSWAFNFLDAEKGKYDYDNFRLESVSVASDTVAEMDFNKNELALFRVNKLNITNRFNFQFAPQFIDVTFFGNKNFLFDGDILIGNFAFSGNDIEFNYNDFGFYFKQNSILSFLNNNGKSITSSIIHFDDAVLFVDSVENRKGFDALNSFPIFHLNTPGYMSYHNKPVSFVIDPFEINYLNDVSLKNLSFSGCLFLDTLLTNLRGVLDFDSNLNLSTKIETSHTTSLYKNNILFDGILNLNSNGLFASGAFQSNELLFESMSIQLFSGKIIGQAQALQNGFLFENTPFVCKNVNLNFFPYERKFLIKSAEQPIQVYAAFDLNGDLYYDGVNLNANGVITDDYSMVQSSHHYFSTDYITSADASCSFFNSYETDRPFLKSSSVTLERNLLNDSIIIYRENSHFELPLLNYYLDFDVVNFDTNNQLISFENHQLGKEGLLVAEKYRKRGFNYNALNVDYSIAENKICVYSVFPLPFKKYWMQPENNQLCVSGKGYFSTFFGATLIKKRRFLKDKLFNNVDILVSPSLKLSIIND